MRRVTGRAPRIDVSNVAVRLRAGGIAQVDPVPDRSRIDNAGQIAPGVAGPKSATGKLTVQQQ